MQAWTPACPHPRAPLAPRTRRQTRRLIVSLRYDIETITITRREHVDLKSDVAFYKAMNSRAIKRIDGLRLQHQHEIQGLKAELEDLHVKLDAANA